ncbi:hypothetical protein P171DRAFT_118588 [Karstenula rhodostoma CBS 690.94]|uniref:Uncharacterized protein n=1 Tax=Karstenula rhodostoma CBS 690.94 TaxID=1392251 RepID=A0A9P4PA75_9PLEO|nr:hypothetical protein P171DRAFT_118588 [Karstenula rhodostoma CBS 690.94]
MTTEPYRRRESRRLRELPALEYEETPLRRRPRRPHQSPVQHPPQPLVRRPEADQLDWKRIVLEHLALQNGAISEDRKDRDNTLLGPLAIRLEKFLDGASIILGPVLWNTSKTPSFLPAAAHVDDEHQDRAETAVIKEANWVISADKYEFRREFQWLLRFLNGRTIQSLSFPSFSAPDFLEPKLKQVLLLQHQHVKTLVLGINSDTMLGTVERNQLVNNNTTPAPYDPDQRIRDSWRPEYYAKELLETLYQLPDLRKLTIVQDEPDRYMSRKEREWTSQNARKWFKQLAIEVGKGLQIHGPDERVEIFIHLDDGQLSVDGPWLVVVTNPLEVAHSLTIPFDPESSGYPSDSASVRGEQDHDD